MPHEIFTIFGTIDEGRTGGRRVSDVEKDLMEAYDTAETLGGKIVTMLYFSRMQHPETYEEAEAHVLVAHYPEDPSTEALTGDHIPRSR